MIPSRILFPYWGNSAKRGWGSGVMGQEWGYFWSAERIKFVSGVDFWYKFWWVVFENFWQTRKLRRLIVAFCFVWLLVLNLESVGVFSLSYIPIPYVKAGMMTLVLWYRFSFLFYYTILAQPIWCFSCAMIS